MSENTTAKDTMPRTLWTPSDDVWNTSRLGRFATRHAPSCVGDYDALWQWSVEEPVAFWGAVWEDFVSEDRSRPSAVMQPVDSPTGVRWFPGTTVNYAERALAGNGFADDDVAIISESQSRGGREVTHGELRDDVRRCAAGLRRLGVEPGDRVAGYLPNIDETVVAFLATASIGAIWSSCAPEFGVRAVVDRWSQVEPKVLLTIDGYRYGAKDIHLGASVAAIRAELPTLEHTIALRYLDGADSVADSIDWAALLDDDGDELTFEPVRFDHPLYILYSSGTTGLPKAIVHGHGGMLLEHSKQLALHMDLGPGDRFFWFSTTGWMMWNFLVSGLLVGSSIVLFDGNPGHPDLDALWALCGKTRTTYVGLSAPFIMACRDGGLDPRSSHDLSAVRGVGSTGAPLPAIGFEWVADHVGAVPLSSISGGTDVCSAFLGGAPVLDVVAGVIPCRQLGWKIDSFDPDGASLRNREGELVITSPAPSMPVSLWGDDGSRYRTTYFDDYPGVWRHGDWITIADDGSCVVSGRSDATLNRGGVRLGTADFYTVVESDEAVTDSLVVHLEDDAGGLGELLLFVLLQPGQVLDDELRRRLAGVLRSELSPRHAPDEILAVPAIPRTLSGKKLEVPVKRILQGTSVAEAASTGALKDPSALDVYVDIAELRRAGD